MRRAVWLLAASVLVGACGDAGTGPITEPTPVELTVVSGDGQRGLEGETLPDLVRVRVSGADGLPRSGVTVRFQVTAGGGSVTRSEVVSDGVGEATARWRLGPGSVREQRLSVTAGEGGGADEVVVDATAVPTEESDVIIVHGALGPLRGLLALRNFGSTVAVVQETSTADTVIPLQPQDEPGLEVVLLPFVNRPLWATHPWTPGPDTLHVTLQPPVAVDMVFHVRVGDFADQKAAIQVQLDRTTEVWESRHMGVVVGEVTILNEITDTTSIPVTSSGLCSGKPPTDAIQITYITSIDGGRYDGWGCSSGVVHMSLHSRAYPYLLAHELGHTFALQHTPSGLMYGPNPGTFVWDGEILRAHFSPYSALNGLFDAQPAEWRTYCTLGHPCLSADYLLGQALLTAPGRLAARVLHDGLRPGGRPLDGVEEEFVGPPRLSPELRPEAEEHHVP